MVPRVGGAGALTRLSLSATVSAHSANPVNSANSAREKGNPRRADASSSPVTGTGTVRRG